MWQVQLQLEPCEAVSDHNVKSVIQSPRAEAGVVRPRHIVFQHQRMDARISALRLQITRRRLNLPTTAKGCIPLVYPVDNLVKNAGFRQICVGLQPVLRLQTRFSTGCFYLDMPRMKQRVENLVCDPCGFLTTQINGM